jgi:hypothetical protein
VSPLQQLQLPFADDVKTAMTNNIAVESIAIGASKVTK